MSKTIPDDLAVLPERLPSFYILGGPKCGTTSLFEWLRRHPDTFLPAKEPNFLSRDIYDTRHLPGAMLTWDDYLARLAPLDQFGKITGESTPRYLYSDMALDILAQHPARPPLIVILRNPIDLVYSLHGQMVRQGVETETDFSKAWKQSLLRHGNSDAWLSSENRMDRRLDYPMFGKLGIRMQAVNEKVSDDRLRVMVLEEDLSHTPERIFADILDFLGLQPTAIDFSRENTRVELRSAAVNRLFLKARTLLVKVNARLGFDVRPSYGIRTGTGVLKILKKFNFKQPETVPKLTAEMRRELAAYFCDDVALLEAELGRAVPVWQDWPSKPAVE